MAFIVGTLQARLELNPGQFNRALEKAKGRGDQAARNFQRNTKRLSRDLDRYGDAWTRNVTVPLLAFGALSTRAALQFESSFAGVRKTVDATEEELAGIRDELRAMAREEIPISLPDLNRIAELGGQLNIQSGNILGFTRTIAMVGDTTDIALEAAAEGFAQFGNVMQTPQQELDRMGATIVDLGNNSATTESKILDFGLRIAGAGRVAGLTEAQVLGLGASLASTGLEAEAGGTAISRVIFEISGAVERGGDRLEQFAAVAGESAESFQQHFRDDAASAIVSFVEGLGRIQAEGGNVGLVLDELGIDQIRVRDALLRTAGAGDLMRESIARGSRAWRENTALVIEANKRYETSESQLRIQVNRLQDVAATLGEKLLPPMVDVAEQAASVAEAFGELPDPVQRFAVQAGIAGASLGPLFYVGSNVVGVFRTMVPLARKARDHIRALSLEQPLLATNTTKAWDASKGLTIGLTGLAFVVGYKVIPGLINLAGEILGLGPLFDNAVEYFNRLINSAKELREQEIDALLGDPQQYLQIAKNVNRMTLELRKAGKISQQDFLDLSFDKPSGLPTRDDISRLLDSETAVRALYQAMLEEGRAAAAAAKARAEAAAAGDMAAVQTEEQKEAVESMVAALEDELAQLQLTNLAYLERKLRAQNATEEQIQEALAAQRAVDAARAKQEQDDESRRSDESRRRSIEQTILALEDDARASMASADALIVHQLVKQGATAGEIAYAQALLETVRAKREQAELEAEAAQIIDRAMTVEQRRVAELARIVFLHEQGFLTLQQYNQALDELAERYDQANVHGLRMGITAEDVALAAHRAFADNLFGPFANGVEGMVEAFSHALQRMLAEALATQLFQALNLGSLLGLSAGGSATGAAAPVGKAAGGVVMGPGTPTSDSIPALLSDGEFVIQAAAVRRYGAGVFDALNDMRVPTLDRLPAFAGGGAVGGAGAVALGSGGGTFNVNIDARGAAPGVGAEIRRALAETEKRAVTRSVATMVDRRRRGGAFAENFRR